MADVLIMMATYNGEQYIREQINSILVQDYTNWNLLIRDDGSTDNTVDIISEYLGDTRIFFEQNTSEKHGFISNFKELVLDAKTEYEYYMFCDQDDIWDENKISRMLMQAKKRNSQKPILIQADMRLIDCNGTVINNSLQSEYDMKVKRPMADVFFSNRTYGCNILFNKVLFLILKESMQQEVYKDIGHDIYAARVAAVFGGEICFVDDALMSYRRHGDNVTAKQNYSINAKRVIQRVVGFSALSKDLAHLYDVSIKSINVLLEIKSLPKEKKVLLEELKTCFERGGIQGYKTWKKYKVTCGATIRTFSHFLILILGTYKRYMESKNENSSILFTTIS